MLLRNNFHDLLIIDIMRHLFSEAAMTCPQ